MSFYIDMVLVLSFRERNNIARRKAYNKKKEHNDGKAFEIYAINYHKEKYGHEVWPQKEIPEDELYNCGFIHDYNKERLKRIASNRERSGESCLYQDYGMDYLTKDKNGIYGCGQAKNYICKVSANDLGTFFSVLYTRFKNESKGYIATTSLLTANLYEDIQNSEGKIVHIHIKDFNPKLGPSKSVTSSPFYEVNLPLRPEQKEAISYIDKGGHLILNAVCAFGKTLVLGHRVQKCKHSIIVCLAPLKEHVKNLQERVTPFIPNYEPLLVDSDQGGETDPNIINEFIKNNKCNVIFSTYKSFVEVLYNILPKDNIFIAVDECHNALSYSTLCEYINNFKDVLFMSAAIPEEFYESFPNAEMAYQFSLREAIDLKYICDYEIIVPYEDIDMVLSCIESQIYFLMNGMLKYGCRRCIVYCNSQKECDEFLDKIKKIAREYHGLNVWGDKIVDKTSSYERSQIIDQFQSDLNNIDLYILTSVRILDEAVNIPRCDSVLITNVTDKSSNIRMYQRMMRSARLDKHKPSKKNHIFVWANEDNCLEPFSRLREQDIEFHKKIKVCGTNYDNNMNPSTTDRINEKITRLYEIVKTIGVTLEERWDNRRLKWIEQYQKLGKPPSNMSKDDDEERRAGQWASNIRQDYKKGKLSQERIDKLNATEGWYWEKEDPFESNLELWKKLYKELGKPPSKKSKDDKSKDDKSKDDKSKERRSGQWANNIRKDYKKGKLSQERIDQLNATEGWYWEKEVPFESNLELWKKLYKELKKTPSEKSKDDKSKDDKSKDDEKRRSVKWARNIRQDYKNKLNATEGWYWVGRRGGRGKK